MLAKILFAGLLAVALITPSLASPALADSKPGIAGVWIGARTDPKAAYKDSPFPSPAPFTALGREKSKFWSDPKNNLGARCLPGGGPAGVMSANPLFPLEIIQQDKQVTVLDELMQNVRRIYIDGRKHPGPDDLEKSWMGHAIGHWEGDALVVDTIGVHAGSLNGSGTTVGTPGAPVEPRMPYTESLHMTERLRALDGGKYLEDAITIDDPAIYTHPFQIKRYWRHAPELEMLEYICAETLGDEGANAGTADIPK